MGEVLIGLGGIANSLAIIYTVIALRRHQERSHGG